jgi:hypothetical protein
MCPRPLNSKVLRAETVTNLSPRVFEPVNLFIFQSLHPRAESLTEARAVVTSGGDAKQTLQQVLSDHAVSAD